MFKNERRVFRGRGGPTDRRLPKQNARRRRKHPPEGGVPEERSAASSQPPAPGESRGDCGPPGWNGFAAAEDSVVGTKNEESIQSLDGLDINGRCDPLHSVSCSSSGANLVAGEALLDGAAIVLVANGKEETKVAGPPSNDDEDSGAASDRSKYQVEVCHLRTRIRNTHRAMSSLLQKNSPASTPATALDKYQRHALDATRNTVREYWSILRRYHRPAHDGDGRTVSFGEALGWNVEGDDDDAVDVAWSEHQKLLQEDRKRLGSEIFGLTQQALQCGPLAGSKAGYMKRCGPDMAGRVLRFLQDVFPDDDDDETSSLAVLGLTEKQGQAVREWKLSALRAMAGGER